MFKLFKKKKVINLERDFVIENLEQMKDQPFGVHGFVEMEGNKFLYHHAGSFYYTYKEIIEGRIYEFNTSSQNPVIIDCGANMGLSVFYFAKKYPGAKIIAFEPEEEIFNILKKNVLTYGLQNVSLFKKAVWDTQTALNFFTDKGMGGSVVNVYQNQQPTYVETVVLANYLHGKIDFLKIDIEGAEYRALKSCGALLQNVENIFVEYHSYINQEQHLDDLLGLLKQNGFRYHLRQAFSREHPFMDKTLICENMDMAINIFAYR